MKKILFLLLATVVMHGQTYQNPTLGTVKTMTAPTVTTTPHLGTVEANGTISKITPENLPLSTATTNALELETDVSAGAVSGFTLTNNGNGTVNISSGIAYLRATNDPYAPIIKYPIAAVTNLALTDNANNYVLVDYNGGSPTLTVTTNGSTINTQTNSLAFLIARVGNNLDYLSLVGQNVDPNAKLRVRFLNQEGIRRASGAVLGFSNRNLTLTSSVLFSGLIRINAVDFNTASPDTFTLAYNNGSTWARTTGQTQINNTQYNNAGVLTTMPNNNFRTDYVYLLPNNPSKLYVIMGSTTYSSLTLAKAAPRPSILPVELQAIGLEVGRLFIEKNSATIAEVQSSFANEFTGAPVPEHNSLTGLQGGTSGEYNHLTNAQVTLVNGSEQTVNKATDFTTVNNNLYPTVQATKNYADGLVVGLLNDRGSYDASSDLFPSTGGSGTAGAILKGNLWAVSVAGTLGGLAVGIGDWVRALTDTPGQTASNWSVVEGNFGYVPENVANKSDGYTVSSTTTYPNTKALVDGLATKQNILTNPITGSLTTGYIPMASGTNSLSNSMLRSVSGRLFNGTDDGVNTFQFTGSSRILSGNFNIDPDLALVWGATGATNFAQSYYNSVSKKLIFTKSNGVNTLEIEDSSGNVNVPFNLSAANYTGGATLTGTPTAPTQTAGDNSTKIATTAYVDSAVGAAAEPYLVYTAILNQSGTSDPTATVLRNTLGGTVVWTRSSAGVYLGTLSGAFNNSKTVCFVTGGSNVGTMYATPSVSTDSVQVVKRDEPTNTGTDDLSRVSFEIRVYP